ncbi:hypothetical protein EJ04DRAFT_431748, partial [Polyplosphaeria fusca]
MTQRSLGTSSIACAQLFNKLTTTLQDPECQRRSALSHTGVDDQYGRFRIWGGNLGAFQRLPASSSLDHRLRESPKVAEQIHELLEDLQDSIENLIPITLGDRPNREYQPDEEQDDEDECEPDATSELNSGDVTTETRLSEAEELFESAKSTIASLFRIAMIIRKTAPRDRFARALSSKSEKFDASFDIAHVRQKFPLLQSPEKHWLAERLGGAITQRREYLRYVRDHRDKLSKAPEDLWQPQDLQQHSNWAVASQLDAKSQAATTHLTTPTSTLLPTAASTMYLAEIPMLEKDVPDDISQTSYAVSLGNENDESQLVFPALSVVAHGQNSFECPLCWTIQDIRTESSWRKHGFADLRPYVCTFANCDTKVFSDRRDWFEHELQHHRAEWSCHFCENGDFHSLATFRAHLRNHHTHHADEDQLDAIVEASRQSIDRIPASECPFCLDWELRLREANTDISIQETVVVTPAQFRHHVGTHMQQLALFAIPR